MVKLGNVTDELIYFKVESKSRPETHDVYFHMENGWVCTCEHHYFRKVECKHIRECKKWLSKDKGYTIVGITAYGVLEYDSELINYIINKKIYNEILFERKNSNKGDIVNEN